MRKVVLGLTVLSVVLSADILSECKSKWKTDYSMIKYCVNKQTVSRGVVVNLYDSEIKSSCMKKWGTDYSMVRYCINKQQKAKRELGL